MSIRTGKVRSSATAPSPPSPSSVIEIASAWAKGLRDGGVIPCGKHFPGHGDTDKDSHFELPMVCKSLEELARHRTARPSLQLAEIKSKR